MNRYLPSLSTVTVTRVVKGAPLPGMLMSAVPLLLLSTGGLSLWIRASVATALATTRSVAWSKVSVDTLLMVGVRSASRTVSEPGPGGAVAAATSSSRIRTPVASSTIDRGAATEKPPTSRYRSCIARLRAWASASSRGPGRKRGRIRRVTGDPLALGRSGLQNRVYRTPADHRLSARPTRDQSSQGPCAGGPCASRSNRWSAEDLTG